MNSASEIDFNVIPIPQRVVITGGKVMIPDRIGVNLPDMCLPQLETIQALVDIPIRPEECSQHAWIRCRVVPQTCDFPPEGYRMTVTENGVDIESATSSGIFYGLITLAQMLANASGGLACGLIEDYPRFSWRGFLMDEARHFQGKEQIKQILDWMAIFKLNRLHWHLTDYQGWRIEIQSYPELTTKGSLRARTQLSGFGRRKKIYREEQHGGFYSQEEIKEIIAYAAVRQIQVIPEFDFPGHFAAAIAAYPHLGCRKQPMPVPGEVGVLPCNACIGDERTLEFIRSVLDEICELFPGEIIHIGGDEVDPQEWEYCPLCTARKELLGLEHVLELQDWLMNEMGAYLITKGKQPFVWNDADHGNLASELGVTDWIRNRKKGVKHIEHQIQSGRQVVFQKFRALYFDWPYALIPLRTTYHYDPTRRLPAEEIHRVLGVQGALWTEFVDSSDRLQWCLFPRLAALSEMAWTEKKIKNFHHFSKRWQTWNVFKKKAGIVGEAPLSISNPKNPLRRLWVLLNSLFKTMRYEQEQTQKIK